ncbi:hypothetical protein LZ554_001432 [Drepanopeziza brunnea f. sp. 'monogermtubi']|nr:hypothetical protein LZ554_001432 [Drepanopeziza brunnea f. sp. 'monogermtubi']
MQHLFNTLLAVLALAAASTAQGLCKKPRCTGYCADGFPYNCCVVYIRDPCSDHLLASSPSPSSTSTLPAPSSTTTNSSNPKPTYRYSKPPPPPPPPPARARARANANANGCTGPDDFECVCQCENGSSSSYLCNADYLRDPCEDLGGAP